VADKLHALMMKGASEKAHKKTVGSKKKGLSRAKARKMLHEGKAQGHALTKRQRGYFGAVASGANKK